MSSIISKFKWTREPERAEASDGCVKVTTKPHTDLWQRTYYHFRNDNSPVFQMTSEEKFFSFTVKTEFPCKRRLFDQCGIVMYLDSDNWLKASVEYNNEDFGYLGSVVTNLGYSDWATQRLDASIGTVWYRLSRREDDFCIEYSLNGKDFSQMRICHIHNAAGTVDFGIYACSPENSSFTAVFSEFELGECKWAAHDGQSPDY